MKKIYITKSKYTIVDNEDFNKLGSYNWCFHNGGYAVRRLPSRDGGKVILMHREIIGNIPKGLKVDHINRNKLDNQRKNLRVVTNAENARNRSINKNTKSGYRGVYWSGLGKKWEAKIKLNYKSIWLGLFDSKLEASFAYDRAANKYFGRFAVLNHEK